MAHGQDSRQCVQEVKEKRRSLKVTTRANMCDNIDQTRLHCSCCKQQYESGAQHRSTASNVSQTPDKMHFCMT